MKLDDLGGDIIGLGLAVSKVMDSINNKFKFYNYKKQNKLFIQEDNPSYPEDHDVWIDTSDQPMFAINITQSPHQMITITSSYYNNKTFAENIQVPKGTLYKATIQADDGYIAGDLNTPGGTVTEDVNISATAAMPIAHKVTITQSDHQNITVTIGGKDYTSDISVADKVEYTAVIKPDVGYNAGTLSSTSGTITKDITISASPATIETCTLTIVQKEHETITANIVGKDITETGDYPYGSPFTATIKADEHYIAGKLSIRPEIEKQILKNNSVIIAEPATLETHKISIAHYDNQDITITTTDDKKEYNADIDLPYGTKYSAKVVAKDGNTAGTLQLCKPDGTVETDTKKSEVDDLTVSEDLTIKATAATEITYSFKGNADKNSAIKADFTYPDGNTKTVTSNAIDEKCATGTTYVLTPVGNEGFTPGTLVPIGSTGTITKDTTVSLTSAQPIYKKITITQTDNQTITVTTTGNTVDDSLAPKADHTETFNIAYWTTFKVTIKAADGYTAGKLSITDGTVKDDVTVSATAATKNK